MLFRRFQSECTNMWNSRVTAVKLFCSFTMVIRLHFVVYIEFSMPWFIRTYNHTLSRIENATQSNASNGYAWHVCCVEREPLPVCERASVCLAQQIHSSIEDLNRLNFEIAT